MSYSFLPDVPRERKRLIVAMAILASIVLVLDYFGNIGHFYQANFGYDKIVHFTAGAFCGVFGIWLFHPSGAMVERWWAISAAFILSFWIGGAWEVYEIIYGQPDLTVLVYWSDTLTDMIADISGGILAGALYHEKR